MFLVSVKRLWDKAQHNAFTDLVRFQERWWCVFREGEKHVSPDGALRVITSSDGETWESAALLQSATEDLRDGKLSVTSDGRLLLIGAGTPASSRSYHQTYAWFSENGYDWSAPIPIGERNYWLWRVVWHEGVGYGVGYFTNRLSGNARLYRTTDGIDFKPLVCELFTEGYPNETGLLFLPDQTALILLRRDPVSGRPNSAAHAVLGMAHPPYTQWTWRDIGVRIGGPCMIMLPDGRIVAAVRLYDGATRTSLCWVNPAAGELTEALTLPSGGDTSYAGMVWHDDLLWISYYSSHEAKTTIYLAKVRLAPDLRSSR